MKVDKTTDLKEVGRNLKSIIAHVLQIDSLSQPQK